MQVRLTKNRLEIVKDLLKKIEHSYKSYDKLLSLARALRINDLPQVMLIIAECALDKKNMSVLTHMCASLVKHNHGQAWTCVHNLALHLCRVLIEHHKIILYSPNQAREHLIFIFSGKEKYPKRNRLIHKMSPQTRPIEKEFITNFGESLFEVAKVRSIDENSVYF